MKDQFEIKERMKILKNNLRVAENKRDGESTARYCKTALRELNWVLEDVDI